MKTKLLGIGIIILGVLTIGYSQYGGSSIPSSDVNSLSAQGGRYVFGQTGTILGAFMLDTQTGRLWKLTEDQQNSLGLTIIPYIGLDQKLYMIPQKGEEGMMIVPKSTTN